MAFPLANTFEGGSDETTLTAGNSGGSSGDAFDAVFIGGASTIVFDTARASHGSYSMRFAPADSQAVNAQWTATSTGGGFTETWGRFYFYATAKPSNGVRLVSFFTTGGTRQAHIEMTASPNGLLRVADSAFTSGDTVAAIPLDEWVRIEWHVLHSATVGQLEAKIFQADSTSPITNGTVSSPASRNTGASADAIRFGQSTGVVLSGWSAWMDSLQANTTGWPGPATTPPSILFPHRVM